MATKDVNTFSPTAHGRRALITGGGSGIGLGLVRYLAAAGSTVLAVDLDAAKAPAVQAAGGQLVTADVADPGAWPTIVAEAHRRLGGLDLAVFNAGMPLHQEDALTAPIELVERALAVNVGGVIHGLRAAAPLIEASGGGDLVAVASLAGVRRYSEDPYYAMTKHAVVGLSTSAARALRTRGIRMTVICPGLIDTPMVPAALREHTIAAGRALVPTAEAARYIMAALEAGGTRRIWTIQARAGLQEYLPARVPED